MQTVLLALNEPRVAFPSGYRSAAVLEHVCIWYTCGSATIRNKSQSAASDRKTIRIVDGSITITERAGVSIGLEAAEIQGSLSAVRRGDLKGCCSRKKLLTQTQNQNRSVGKQRRLVQWSDQEKSQPEVHI